MKLFYITILLLNCIEFILALTSSTLACPTTQELNNCIKGLQKDKLYSNIFPVLFRIKVNFSFDVKPGCTAKSGLDIGKYFSCINSVNSCPILFAAVDQVFECKPCKLDGVDVLEGLYRIPKCIVRA